MPRRLLVFLIVLLTFRAAATLYAYDRRPVITSNDEIYWAEPAWALLHGQGYTLPCCEGMLFGDFYPQHPPVYVLILAASFKLFGFTPAALRLPSIVAHIVGVALLLALLWRLRRLRVLDRWGFAVAAVLALCNFSTMSLARAGRPDPFTVDFALIGFLILFSGRLKGVPLRRRAWFASAFIGLALSTHTIAVFFLGLFVLTLWILRKRLGGFRWAVYPLLPCLMFVAFWVSIFGSRSLEAMRVHRELAAQMGGTSRPAYRSLEIALQHSGTQAEFLQAGGTTAMLILFSFCLFALRCICDIWWPGRRAAKWAILGVALVAQLGMILNVTSLGITRCYVYFPFTAFVIGLLITRSWPLMRRVAMVCVMLVAVVELGQIGYVLYGTHRDFALRSPNRHDALMDRLAKHRRVAVLPVLWFQARARGLDFLIVDLSVPRQRDEWKNNPHPFAEFDAVVLEGGHPLCNNPDLAGIKPEDFPEIGPWGLLLYELKPPK